MLLLWRTLFANRQVVAHFYVRVKLPLKSIFDEVWTGLGPQNAHDHFMILCIDLFIRGSLLEEVQRLLLIILDEIFVLLG